MRRSRKRGSRRRSRHHRPRKKGWMHAIEKMCSL